MKLNVASNFITRVMQITTYNPTSEQHKHQIFQILRQNDYPSSLINRMINHISHNKLQAHSNHETSTTEHNSNRQHSPQMTNHHPPPPPSSTGTPPRSATSTSTSSPHISTIENPPITNPQQDSHHQISEVKYRSMPNIPLLTRTISTILKKDYSQIKIATRNIKTVKSLLKPVKDPILQSEQHNIIYRIPCNNCDNVYIGMTTNHLKKRISGHKSDINKIANTPTDSNIHAKTALIQHIIDHHHTFNLDSTTIVDRTLRSSALPMLEMCHIHNTPKTVNFRTDVDGLNTAYAGILHTIKKANSLRELATNNSQHSITETFEQLEQ
ncbi:uncharacterized protein LOC110674665 [Aedes aegypti]|uniref:Uncharacterized protein n=1 Tax=Aedes aegypti TaxID=7159 RepID=A0A6I8U8Z4_AEDAE|nr:uncharacterized protein LOC110674665 [Aedes aegypti]